MREPLLTLWDMLKESLNPAPPARPGSGAQARKPKQRRGPGARRKPPRTRSRRGKSTTAAPARTMQARYEQITRQMLELHGVRVRRWRHSMSGLAWQITYQDGRIARLIEAPRPKGPMSAAVFLHEIGHHAIGFNVYKPRCLEEYHAWAFALQQMEVLGLNITDAVRRRMHCSLRYAVQKAQRRGIRQLPKELEPYTRPWTAGVS
jgi:hypothetical protein